MCQVGGQKCQGKVREHWWGILRYTLFPAQLFPHSVQIFCVLSHGLPSSAYLYSPSFDLMWLSYDFYNQLFDSFTRYFTTPFGFKFPISSFSENVDLLSRKLPTPNLVSVSSDSSPGQLPKFLKLLAWRDKWPFSSPCHSLFEFPRTFTLSLNFFFFYVLSRLLPTILFRIQCYLVPTLDVLQTLENPDCPTILPYLLCVKLDSFPSLFM